MKEKEHKPTGDGEISYARLPRDTRFKKRAKLANLDKFDVGAILSEPVTMRAADGTAKKVSPFEAALRSDVKRTIQDRNMAAAARVVQTFEANRVFVPPTVKTDKGLIHAKFDTLEQWEEFYVKLARFGCPPPWPDEAADKWVGIVEYPDPRSRPTSKRRKKGDGQ